MGSRPQLRPRTDVSPADWLIEEIGKFGAGVGGLLPSRFAAYARILHPARPVQHDPSDTRRAEPIPWATVAELSGGRMHRLVQFGALAGTQPGERDFEPDVGELPPHLLAHLCEVLVAHTATPDRCWYCLWDGFGWIHGSPSVGIIRASTNAQHPPVEAPPAFPEEILDGPRVSLPDREYILFEGPLAAATEMGWPSGALLSAAYPELDFDPEDFEPQSPNLLWPEDRSWCVATEIDLDSTYVGGSEALIDALLADPRFEAWPARLDDRIDAASDEINR